MAETTTTHTAHVSRIHHHRNRVRAARAAIDTAVSQSVAASYPQPQAGGGSRTPSPPTRPRTT